MTLVNPKNLLKELIELKAYLGHQSNRWNPKMGFFIYKEKNGMHIIDLVQTTKLIIHACKYLFKASKKGKSFLLIGTKRQAF